MLDDVNRVMLALSQASNQEMTQAHLQQHFAPLKDGTRDASRDVMREGDELLALLARPVLTVEK